MLLFDENHLGKIHQKFSIFYQADMHKLGLFLIFNAILILYQISTVFSAKHNQV